MPRTNRPAMTITDKVAYVGELVAFLYDRTQSGLGAIALVRAGDAALMNIPDDSIETRMMRLSARAIIEYFAIRAARMLDPAGYGNACLPEVFELLGDGGTRSAVLDAASYTGTPRPTRDQHMNNAFTCWNAVSVDPRRNRLRELRSHTLAHNLIHRTLTDGLAGGISYADLVTYAETVFGVIDDLAWACLGTNQLDTVRAEAEPAAARIWQRLVGHT